MPADLASVHPLWFLITRLGEAQALLPLGLACAWWLRRHAALQTLAMPWLGALAIGAGMTLITKLAFIGWGLGHAGLDFTGISGHTMLASAIYPLMLRLLAAPHSLPTQRAAWLVGHGLAWLVACSRVKVQAHSWSEVLAGMAVGTAVGLMALQPQRKRSAALPVAVPALFAAWLLATAPAQAGTPAVNTHRLVTQIALGLSGRSEPYTRRDLHRWPHGAETGAR